MPGSSVRGVSRFDSTSFVGLRPLFYETDWRLKQIDAGLELRVFFEERGIDVIFVDELKVKLSAVDSEGNRVKSSAVLAVLDDAVLKSRKVCWFSGVDADTASAGVAYRPSSYNTDVFQFYDMSGDVFHKSKVFSFTDNSVGKADGVFFTSVEEVKDFCEGFVAGSRVSYSDFRSFLSAAGLSAFVGVMDSTSVPSALVNDSFFVHALMDFPSQPRAHVYRRHVFELLYGVRSASVDVMPSLGCLTVHDDDSRWVLKVAESFFGEVSVIGDSFDEDGFIDYGKAVKFLAELYVAAAEFLFAGYGRVSAFHVATLLCLSTQSFVGRGPAEAVDSIRLWFSANDTWGGSFDMLRMCLSRGVASDVFALAAESPVEEWLRVLVE